MKYLVTHLNGHIIDGTAKTLSTFISAWQCFLTAVKNIGLDTMILFSKGTELTFLVN